VKNAPVVKERAIQLYGLQHFRKCIHTPPEQQKAISELDWTPAKLCSVHGFPGKKTRLPINIKALSAESDYGN
jgi:hypothetical protein